MAARKTGTHAAAARGQNARARTTRRAAPPTRDERLDSAAVLAALEAAGTEQNRKVYRRHGAEEPLYGVSFAELKKLVKRIGVDHQLACELWESGNCDARTLAIKVADPAVMTSADLDRWLGAVRYHLLVHGVAQLAGEGRHAQAKVRKWIRKTDEQGGVAAWALVGHMAARDESLDDAWFAERLAEIEAGIGTAPNLKRAAMNQALIAIGGRSAELRKAALAAAKRIGRVAVDHGETACKTPDAATYIEKTWAHSRAKRFPSPAAQERARPSVRVRC
jgi:3-methyladenine DNA glycosylase AlkD